MPADAVRLLQAILFCGLMLYAAVEDIRSRTIDDKVCLLIALAGLATASPASIIGAVCAALPFYLGSGFGLNGAGDIYLSAAAGFVVGAKKLVCAFSLFLVWFSLFVAVLALVRLLRKKPPATSFPLAPFLSLGFIPAYFLI